MHFLGIEIGGTKLQLVVGSADGKILARQRLQVDRASGAPGIRQQIERAVADWKPQFTFAAAGVGFGGPVDVRRGRIACSHQIDGWNDFPLRDWLAEILACPVIVDNDANVAALAEAHRGAGAGCNPMFYTNCGSGVGGGLVLAGQIYHGLPPGEVEFGHIRLNTAGDTVESRCSGWAVDKRVEQLCREHPSSILAQVAAGRPSAAALAPAIAKGCPIAAGLLREVANDFALGLSHVVHLFHPQSIVLGGGLSLLGEPWRKAVADALPKYVMKAFAPGLDIVLAGLGEDVVTVGALLLAAQASQTRPAAEPLTPTQTWIQDYLTAHKAAADSIPVPAVAKLVDLLRKSWEEDHQVFIFGNGGSAANASHFATDLGKGASDKLPRRFRTMSLNDNVAWMTALGNDYSYDEIFSRQLANYARPGDIVFTMSVSGNSPNLVKAVEWSRKNGVITVALVGQKRGRLAELADHVVVIGDTHYGRAEDTHMTIAHILCYYFMESTPTRIGPELHSQR